MDPKTIWIGCDHGGFELKRKIIRHLNDGGYTVHDVGTDSGQIVRYPYFAAEVAAAVAEGRAERGVLICSTGIGMSIVANRFNGVRASMCTSVHMAHMTRAHNDSNVLCLGGTITPEIEALSMVDEWLATPYEGGRHDISLGLIQEAEQAIADGGRWGAMRQVEVKEDALDDGGIGEEGQDPHVSATSRAQERQHLVDACEELGPADSGGAARRR